VPVGCPDDESPTSQPFALRANDLRDAEPRERGLWTECPSYGRNRLEVALDQDARPSRDWLPSPAAMKANLMPRI
jgi:hypothetical protein